MLIAANLASSLPHQKICFRFKLVELNWRWLKWLHLRTFIRLHTAPSGDTKGLLQHLDRGWGGESLKSWQFLTTQWFQKVRFKCVLLHLLRGRWVSLRRRQHKFYSESWRCEAGKVCVVSTVPELQLDSPPVQEDVGRLIVDPWNNNRTDNKRRESPVVRWKH